MRFRPPSFVVLISWMLAAASLGCGRIGFGVVDRGDGGADAAWWDLAWGYRLELVVDHTRVAADLVDFPVLVSVEDAALGHARADGADVVFVDAANHPLAHELEHVAVSPGKLQAWVKLPAVSATADTTFYLYYGNATATTHEDPPGVWTNAFTGVYHFSGAPPGPVDTGDSTGVNAGTNNGAVADTGWVQGAARFAGMQNITANAAGVDATAGATTTVTLWMNYAGVLGDAVFAFGNASGGYDLWMVADGCFGFNTENGEVLGSTRTGLLDRWAYVAAVFYNGVPAAGQNQLYIDGEPQALSLCTGTSSSSRLAGGMVLWASGGIYQFAGLLDEGRVARGTRSAAWIQTEYANMRNPLLFVRSRPEQHVP
jgi:MSHA biogenesis protein MshQ